MNINLNKSNRNCQLFPVFQDQASPYLSPLQGLNSPISSIHDDNFLNFVLEEESQKLYSVFDNEPQKLNELQQDQYGQSSPLDRLSDQEKGETKQLKTPSYLAKPSHSKVESIIRFLVGNDKLSEIEIKSLGKPLYQNSDSMEYVFQTLMTKFKKLKKTKEEMTKFCMRKAFKFVNDEKKITKRKALSAKSQKEIESDDIQFQMPFKKNSSQKTMNNQFLKQIFSRREFAVQYNKFLNEVHDLIQEDNDNKITYLTNMIEGFVLSNQLKKIESIKRLPWTQSILKRTEDLAFSMLEFTEGELSSKQNEEK